MGWEVLRQKFSSVDRLQKTENSESRKVKKRSEAAAKALEQSELDMAETNTDMQATNKDTLTDTITRLLDPNTTGNPSLTYLPTYLMWL